jgi:hypothetical protein
MHRPTDDASAHERHAPVHATLQQTPSTQNVLAHCEPFAQAWPFCLAPQLPAMQVTPGAQSAFELQVARHAPPAQANGAQLCTPGGRHAPLPLHVPAVSRRSPTQPGSVQTVSAG